MKKRAKKGKRNYFVFASALLAVGALALVGSQLPGFRDVESRYLVGATDMLLVFVDNPAHPLQDTTAPTVTLIGASTINLNVGDAYVEQGATSTDNVDTNLPIKIFVDGSPTSTTVATTHIDTSAAGGHTVLYTATDSAGNVGSALRIVVVSAPSSGGGGGGGGGGSSGGGGGGGGASAGGAVGIPVPATTPACAKKKGDINCDNKVNLVDFSILAYWYKRPLTAQAIAEGVDLNGDGKVTLADFSILAYYWTK